MKQIEEMRRGFETAFINRNINSNLAYQPEFVSNQPADQGLIEKVRVKME